MLFMLFILGLSLGRSSGFQVVLYGKWAIPKTDHEAKKLKIKKVKAYLQVLLAFPVTAKQFSVGFM